MQAPCLLRHPLALQPSFLTDLRCLPNLQNNSGGIQHRRACSCSRLHPRVRRAALPACRLARVTGRSDRRARERDRGRPSYLAIRCQRIPVRFVHAPSMKAVHLQEREVPPRPCSRPPSPAPLPAAAVRRRLQPCNPAGGTRPRGSSGVLLALLLLIRYGRRRVCACFCRCFVACGWIHLPPPAAAGWLAQPPCLLPLPGLPTVRSSCRHSRSPFVGSSLVPAPPAPPPPRPTP
jgi:hypothetical protein